jgi:hypothetical protein
MKSPWFAIAPALAVALAALYFWPRADVLPALAQAPSPAAQAPPVVQTPAAAMAYEEAQEEALESLITQPASEGLFERQSEHFTPALIDAEGRFVGDETRLSMDKSCTERLHKPDATRSIEAQLQGDYGLNAKQRVPEDVFFETLTQFFQLDGQYYQLSARARTASRPPVYGFEFYVASDAGMRETLTKLALPVPIPPNADARSVRAVVEQTLALFTKQGAQIGARTLQVRVIGGPEEPDQEIRYFNATPEQWAFGSGVCQLSATKRTSLCRCLPDGAIQGIPGS